MKKMSSSAICSVTLLASAFFTNLPLIAQQSAADTASDLFPDAPSAIFYRSSDIVDDPQATSSQPTAQQPQQNNPQPPKRLFYVIPNFRSVNTTTVLPPQSVKEKFVSASQDTFDYSSLVLEVILASYNYGLDKTPEFGTGGVAFGRYLWHAAADQSVENYMVEFVVPTIAHEDTRYYQLGHGGFKKRAIYSLTRILITRTDSDHERINTGELLGAAGATAISQRYYPCQERTVGNFFGQYGTSLVIDAAAFFLREFEPEISHKIFRSKVPIGTATPQTPPNGHPDTDALDF
jgi:hypothetical protein